MIIAARSSRCCLAYQLAWLMRGHFFMLVVLLCTSAAEAQETVCARVKIEIKQKLTLERQGFDAQMRINNTTEAGVIEDVGVDVKVMDESGTPVTVTTNPNDLTAKFYIRISSLQSISAVDGSGMVAPKSTAQINWLLIPAPGAAGNTPLGKKYLIGATLRYRYAGENTVLEVSPDVVTVRPMPLLTLDYFLPADVTADDPLTPAVEPIEPFTLGVRVKNTGLATAKSVKIESAQPKIVENNQGLLIGFKLNGSYVDDAPVSNSLLIDFGDIAPSTGKMGRWLMETTLSGKFTEFTAKFTHADELGGALTSLLQAVNTHTLIHDVRVDLQGRDGVRDFLARDGDFIHVYESEGTDTEVTDRSGAAQLTAAAGGYRLSFPPTAGFAYVRLPDPFAGQKVVASLLRSDAKVVAPENVWLSKTLNAQTKKPDYWVHVFDVNSTGQYDTVFQNPAGGPQPPVIQLIADRVVAEGKQVSFLVEASSPEGKPVALSAAPLPAGAVFTPQATDSTAPTLSRAIFDWTPAKGQAGSYLITYTASDGTLSATRSATIKVETTAPPSGPGAPSITSPLSGAQVTTLRPTLAAQASIAAQDPTTQLQFELYADEAMIRLVASILVPKAPDAPGNGAGNVPQPTTWAVPVDLADNTPYWWRVRAFDGSTYSLWANARFFVNLFNDPPDRFNLLLPVPGGEVAELQPTLSWSNANDKDGDAVSYGVRLYSDAALSDLVGSVDGIAADPSGTTSWQVATALTLRRQYFWRVIATDALGAQTLSSARPFFVGVGNVAPGAPGIASPAPGAMVNSFELDLVVSNATDADGDLITDVFELDTSPAFNTGAKRSSGQVIQGSGPNTAWHVAGLIENTRYYWRAKAQDGRAESAWVQGSFFVNTVNDPPSQPTVRNPGNGAWVSSQAPVLELNPATDPEGGALRYEFQIAKDANFSQVLQSGQSDNPGWMVANLLGDKTTYWWRGRAVDPEGASSAWSATAVMYVSTGDYQPPVIHVTAPAAPISPSVQAGRKSVRLSWEGTDLNIEPTVALYYATSKAGFSGTLIADGLRQASGTQAGNYDWDAGGLAAGTYFVYAVIYDSRGSAQAWAPGAVVITPETQSGSVLVNAAANLQTNELGAQASFAVRLGSAPSDEVVLPVASTMTGEGRALPPSLTFNAQNWNIDQQVMVTGQSDCIPDGNRQYQVQVGKAVSLDPQYMGLAAAPVNLVNQDYAPAWVATTNNPNVRICALSIRSTRKVDATTWEYVLDAVFGNSGAPVQGGAAKLVAVPPLLQLVDPDMQFGALHQGETGNSLDTITVRAKGPLSAAYFQVGAGLRWSITVK